MHAAPDGRFEVRFRLLDAVKQAQLAGFAYTVAPAQMRATAHKIADIIYEKLTGDAGVFSTRIAYVAKQGTRFELHVADADGFNSQSDRRVERADHLAGLVARRHAHRLRLVREQEAGRLRAVAGHRADGRCVANFRGSNSAPAWSPGRQPARRTLSKDGGSQIYLINADGSGVQRLTTHAGDRHRAELRARRQVDPVHLRSRRQPADLPDDAGERRGRAHDLRGQLQRLAALQPDGKCFVFMRRDGGRFNLAMQDFATRQVQVLTQGSLDESPTSRRTAADPLRVRERGAWYIGRRLQRWPGQAATHRGGKRCARARVGPAAQITIGRRTTIRIHDTNQQVHMRSLCGGLSPCCAVLARLCQSTPTPESGAPVEERTAVGRHHGRRDHRRPPAARWPAASGVGATRSRIRATSLSKRSVYFDFDRYVVKDEYKPLVEAHGKYLQPTEREDDASRATPTSAAAANTTSRSASGAPTR